MAKLKRFKVFYGLKESDSHVASDSLVEMSEADIYSELLGGLKLDGDFIGLVDGEGATLQVMFEQAPDQYWVELPDPEMGGSHGRYFSFDEIVDLFKALPKHFDTSAITGLEFQSWG